ncbi:cysteine peptidase family C39 domain-containing protein, partial [Streptosporangium sp. NPDC006013]|uniref:cysteine peptidase family C39 domain-containing protein n=1 Tax=Streptosporangium sp. NPDC006013 TaxID=3155596 RepID=UPI00339E00E7
MTNTTLKPAEPAKPAPKNQPRPPRPRRKNRHRVPTVIQMESVECGAAALAMVLGHYGKHVPLEELRGRCGVSRDGSKASSMLAAARSYGMIAKGFQVEAELLRDQSGPVIIFWAFQHFIVVEGLVTRFGRTMVAINDPSSGPRLMEWSEFDSGFTGIMLTFEPGPDFKPGGERAKLSKALLQWRLPSGRALPLVLLASVLLLLPGIAGPAYYRVFIDRVLSGNSPDILPPLLIVMVFTAAATFVLTSVQQYYLLRLEIRVGLVGSARFFRHLLRLPIEFFLQRRPAEVAKRISTNDTVAEILSRDLALTVINMVLVAFYAALLVRYDVLLGVIGVGMAALNILVLRWVARARKDAVTALRTDRGNLTGTTFATLSMIETVKATGAEPDAFTRWAGFLAKVVSAQQRLGVPTAVLVVVPPLLATVNTGLMLLIGGLRVVEGVLSIGILISFQTLLAALSRPVTQLTNLGGRLQDLSADAKRIHDVERHPIARCFERAGGEAELGTRLEGRLELQEVTFGYGPLSDPVIKNLSLSMTPGSRVAIVGGSGSGKSTLGRLL